MRYKITHRTSYHYSQSVSLCHNEARLRPRSDQTQTCLASDVFIDPAPAVRSERLDVFGNHVLYFAVQQNHQELIITSTSEVERRPLAALDLGASLPWEEARRAAHDAATPETREAQQFLLDSPSVAAAQQLSDYAASSFTAGRPLLAAALDLCARIHREFVFDQTRTTISTPLADVLAQRAGVCQDFAHLAIGCLRSLGLPARYMSGYLETLPPPGQARLIGADASHAWCALHAPGLGWVEFDPTNDQMPDERYVTIGWGRDYSDVTPFKGVIFGGGAHTLEVGVDMLRA